MQTAGPTGAVAAAVHADVRRESPTAIRLTSMSAGHVGRRPESVASTIAILRRARDLIADERRWCKRSFARGWEASKNLAVLAGL